MSDLDSSGYYALAAPLVFLVMGGEAWVNQWQGREHSGVAVGLGNLSTALGGLLAGLFMAPLLVGLYALAFEHLGLIQWAEDSWWPWVLALLLGDFCYYLDHRASHRFGLLWAFHSVHHRAETYDYTVAVRRFWFSDLQSIVFYAPLPLLGIPPDAFFVMITVVSFYAFFVHTRTLDFPGFGVLITPRAHVLHHARATDPRGSGNFGATFVWWDWMLGTYRENTGSMDVDVGMVERYQTHDGVRSQWTSLTELQAQMARCPSRAEAVSLLWKRPRSAEGSPGVQVALPWGTRVYAVVQFALLSAAAAALLWGRDAIGLPTQVVSFAVLVAWLACIGALLDQRPHAWRWEATRWASMAALGLTLWIV